ncbi:hypothetical protein Tco_0650658 [Tanacetum coccineum]
MGEKRGKQRRNRQKPVNSRSRLHRFTLAGSLLQMEPSKPCQIGATGPKKGSNNCNGNGISSQKDDVNVSLKNYFANLIEEENALDECLGGGDVSGSVNRNGKDKGVNDRTKEVN